MRVLSVCPRHKLSALALSSLDIAHMRLVDLAPDKVRKHRRRVYYLSWNLDQDRFGEKEDLRYLEAAHPEIAEAIRVAVTARQRASSRPGAGITSQSTGKAAGNGADPGKVAENGPDPG
jgi:hypothetical protein